MVSLVSSLLAVSAYIFAGIAPGICGFVRVEEQGLCYNGGLDIFPESLSVPFPTVYADADGGVEGLPYSVVEDTIPFVSIEGVQYRDVYLQLSLRPYTPDFLIPYISSCWDGWGGSRIPYYGEWQLSFDEETIDGWIRRETSGVISPSCLSNVSSDLLADADFNGVPSAFWNHNVNREQ